MKADPTNPVQELKEAAPPYGSPAIDIGGDVDIALLRASLAMTPWERMQANDDALNFAESLRAAMKQRNAKPQ